MNEKYFWIIFPTGLGYYEAQIMWRDEFDPISVTEAEFSTIRFLVEETMCTLIVNLIVNMKLKMSEVKSFVWTKFVQGKEELM